MILNPGPRVLKDRKAFGQGRGEGAGSVSDLAGNVKVFKDADERKRTARKKERAENACSFFEADPETVGIRDARPPGVNAQLRLAFPR